MPIIYKNSNGDTRTAPKNVTYKEFQKANDMHREDVKNTMNEIAFLLMEKGKKHDWTKKDYEEMFYNNFLSTLNNGTNFVEDEWYQLHIEKEKHHLFSKCHDDVDLLDVIEMVVDCVCAGKARSGEIRGLEIDQEILDKALKNTVKKINEMVKCEE